MESPELFAALEILADTDGSTTSLLKEVIKIIPGFWTNASDTLKEKISLRYLEECSGFDNKVLLLDGSGTINVNRSVEEVLLTVLTGDGEAWIDYDLEDPVEVEVEPVGCSNGDRNQVTPLEGLEKFGGRFTRHDIHQYILRKRATLPKYSPELNNCQLNERPGEIISSQPSEQPDKADEVQPIERLEKTNNCLPSEGVGKSNCHPIEGSGKRKRLDALTTPEINESSVGSVIQSKRRFDHKNSLDRRLRLAWTTKEEEKLKEIIQRLDGSQGYSWIEIMELGSGVFDNSRKPADLRTKWRSMQKKESKA